MEEKTGYAYWRQEDDAGHHWNSEIIQMFGTLRASWRS